MWGFCEALANLSTQSMTSTHFPLDHNYKKKLIISMNMENTIVNKAFRVDSRSFYNHFLFDMAYWRTSLIIVGKGLDYFPGLFSLTVILSLRKCTHLSFTEAQQLWQLVRMCIVNAMTSHLTCTVVDCVYLIYIRNDSSKARPVCLSSWNSTLEPSFP